MQNVFVIRWDIIVTMKEMTIIRTYHFVKAKLFVCHCVNVQHLIKGQEAVYWNGEKSKVEAVMKLLVKQRIKFFKLAIIANSYNLKL